MSRPLEQIELARRDGVATITLDRPQRLNAFTQRMGAELFGTIGELDRDPEIRAIVVTGRGRAFCAGADLDADGRTFDTDWGESRQKEDAVVPRNVCTPILAAINGPAVGVGATVPLTWDIRIASDRARIAFPFTRRGITPEAGSSWILPRLVGMSAAMDLLLTGRTIAADEALRLGLVSRVVPHDELLDTAHGMARALARDTSPVAVALTKRLLWHQVADPDPDHARAREDGIFRWSGRQADAVEGVTSFLEKRPPRWPMRVPEDVPDELLDP